MRHVAWMVLVACSAGEGELGPQPSQPSPVPTPDASGTPEPSSDNLLVVLLDDVGIDLVSAYHPDVDTYPQPTLDRLTSEGLRFTTAYAQPVCSPTRAALLTGRHSRRLGIGDWLAKGGADELAPGVPTLAELLEAAQPDRATAAFGKWHLSGTGSPGGTRHPNERGFDHYAGSMGNISPPYTYREYPMVIDGASSIREGYATTDTVDDAVAWLQRTPEPWFAYVATHAIHEPLHLPPEELHSQAPTSAVGLHGAMLESLDTELARLLDGIPAEQRDRTHIVVLGDNGTAFGAVVEPFFSWSCKGSPNEGGLRVPMWVLGPSVTPGTASDVLVHVTDVLPTVAGLLDLDVDVPLDGVDLGPVLADPSSEGGHDILYGDRFGPAGPGPYTDINWRVVRDRSHKLIFDELTGAELLSRVGPDLRDELPLLPEQKSAADLEAEARLRAELERLRAELTLEVELPR